MPDIDPVVARERRVLAALPHWARYRWLRWRQKRPGAKHGPARVAARTDGLLMAVDEADVIDFAVRHFGAWEPALGALIAAHLRAGDSAVDIGANIGAHTLTMARAVGPSGSVVAVEPGPTTAQRLRANLALNDLTHVRVVEAAADERAGRTLLYAGPDNSRGRATMVAELSGSGAAAEIDTVVAADLLSREDWARTRLIKIDVERAEDRVLRGLAPALALLPADALLIVEAEPQELARRGTSFAALIAPLTARGAEVFALTQHVDLRAMLRPLALKIAPVDPDAVRRTSHTDFIVGDPQVVRAATPR
jgi:FkbM family methyltransferase